MKISQFEPVLSSGMAAQRPGVSRPTLRLYEWEGLILPFKTETHRHLYSGSDLRIVETVRRLIHEEGLNFAGIRRLMSFFPCWKIKPCNAYRRCEVPRITDRPCWSSGKALLSKSSKDCQACAVYQSASQLLGLSIYDLMEGQPCRQD
jgi:MerR family transcriptional regulator/heat shock protein HspR